MLELNKEKVNEAAVRYLKIRGYEILGPDYNDFIVASDEDATVFTYVVASYQNDSFPKVNNKVLRQAFEKAMVSWFKEHQEPSDIEVRCDSISMLVTSENRALIRHHLNAIRM